MYTHQYQLDIESGKTCTLDGTEVSLADGSVVGPSEAQRIANPLDDIHGEGKEEQDADRLKEDFF